MFVYVPILPDRWDLCKQIKKCVVFFLAREWETQHSLVKEYSLRLGEYKSPYENQVFPQPLGVEH